MPLWLITTVLICLTLGMSAFFNNS